MTSSPLDIFLELFLKAPPLAASECEPLHHNLRFHDSVTASRA